ncbi:pectinesterase inhibitor-like [Quercus lobata]|nr:pectinesterase inhibitor-like [Quercus lobata]
MAPSFCASFLLSLMLAILLICPRNAQLGVKVSENVLKSICSQHEDPPFCLKALKSDPRTPSVDLVGLTNISMHFTDVAASKTFAHISSLVNKTTNHNLKASYEVCLEFYDIILGDQEEARTALKARDYFSVKSLSDSCISATEYCGDELTTDTSPLQQENKLMRYICETQTLVSNHLP